METLIFGHKNPDSDSVLSAIAYSYLKNELGFQTIPCTLGKINNESKFILDFFDVGHPKIIDNVKVQINDLDYSKSINGKDTWSILKTYNSMQKNKIHTLAITDDNEHLLGVVTMNDISMGFVSGDYRKLKTSFSNIINDLDANLLSTKGSQEINGKIIVISYSSKVVKNLNLITSDSVVIVGDRKKIIEESIKKKAQLIIITGNRRIPNRLIELAVKNNVNIISTPHDTYETARLISMSNYVSSIMTKEIIKIDENEYVTDVIEIINNSKHTRHPIVNNSKKYLGFLHRNHLLNPNRKKVILVDHNEIRQSADGLEEANLLEVIDHHKIGDISTQLPIIFRNIPVGSTCTIIYKLFLEYSINIPYKIAGLLLSGILSDTLLLTSPTTTEADKKAVNKLNLILDIDTHDYAMKMFKAGTSIQNKNLEELFYSDFKEFIIEDKKIGVSQIFTLNHTEIVTKENDIANLIDSVNKNKDHFSTILLVTDILQGGSYIYFNDSSSNILSIAFNCSLTQGHYIDTIVSRKKQVLPKLSKAIKIYTN